jgi:hypothetical protein
MLNKLPIDLKSFIDGISCSAIIGTIAGHLPSIAAGVSIVWTLIRIYETKTIQKLLSKNKQNNA